MPYIDLLSVTDRIQPARDILKQSDPRDSIHVILAMESGFAGSDLTMLDRVYSDLGKRVVFEVVLWDDVGSAWMKRALHIVLNEAASVGGAVSIVFAGRHHILIYDVIADRYVDYKYTYQESGFGQQRKAMYDQQMGVRQPVSSELFIDTVIDITSNACDM